MVNYDYPGHVIQYEMRLWSKPKLFGAGEGAVIYGENGWNAAHEHFLEGLRCGWQDHEGRQQ